MRDESCIINTRICTPYHGIERQVYLSGNSGTWLLNLKIFYNILQSKIRRRKTKSRGFDTDDEGFESGKNGTLELHHNGVGPDNTNAIEYQQQQQGGNETTDNGGGTMMLKNGTMAPLARGNNQQFFFFKPTRFGIILFNFPPGESELEGDIGVVQDGVEKHETENNSKEAKAAPQPPAGPPKELTVCAFLI